MGEVASGGIVGRTCRSALAKGSSGKGRWLGLSTHRGTRRDFFTTASVSGADVRYQPGCFSVYRRYGNVTVSTCSRPMWLENHQRVLEKAEASLVEAGQLTPRYRCALAKSYFALARNYYDLDRSMYHRLLHRVLSLCPGFEPNESRLYNIAWRLTGFATADRLASYKRRIFRGAAAKE